ncbi:MAG TPA: hypothetical protein VJ602_10300, partial [Paludibacter sp.]|nr:hypothetical protein [Paludibacter sp.]
FVDDKNSTPTKRIKSLTQDLILLIEKAANKKAIEFTDNEFSFWMNSIADIEDNLDAEPNETQVQNALIALSNFEMPQKTDNNNNNRS